jgi:hypothetical protein
MADTRCFRPHQVLGDAAAYQAALEAAKTTHNASIMSRSLEIGCMQSSAREDDCCGCAGSCDGGSRTLRQDVCDCDDQRCNIPADVLEAAGLLADASRGAAVLDTYTRLTAERCVGTYLSVHAGCAAAANAPPPCCCHCCNSLIFAR